MAEGWGFSPARRTARMQGRTAPWGWRFTAQQAQGCALQMGLVPIWYRSGEDVHPTNLPPARGQRASSRLRGPVSTQSLTAGLLVSCFVPGPGSAEK